MTLGEKIRAYVSVLRIDHWVKNLFFLPGFAFALYGSGLPLANALAWRVVVAFIALGLVASVNYSINEIIDAPFDRFHPTKKFRAIPSNKVSTPALLFLCAVLLLAGFGLSLVWVSPLFAGVLAAFFVSGIVYNVRPLRFKDTAILDIITESINNPIRFVAGWFLVQSSFPPVVYLLTFWALGAFWMCGKRYGEYMFFKGDRDMLIKYRTSFAGYSERLLKTILVVSSLIFLGGYTYIAVAVLSNLSISIPFIYIYFIWYGRMILAVHPMIREPESLVKNVPFMAYNLGMAFLFYYIFFHA